MDTIALAALVLSTTLSLLLTPDLHLADLIEPTVQATIAAPITMTAILALRLSGARPIWERRLLTAFLLLMPTVYLLSLALHGAATGWLQTELAGQLFYGALAIAGLLHSGWWLVLGIGAHGLGWDLWHYGRTSFIPDWYAVGCLVVDVGWALYAASRVAVWDAVRGDDAARARLGAARPHAVAMR